MVRILTTLINKKCPNMVLDHGRGQTNANFLLLMIGIIAALQKQYGSSPSWVH